MRLQQEGLPENVYWQDGTMRYLGKLEGGLPTDRGKVIGNNGRVVYEGEFSNGLAEGNGIFYDVNGFRIYEGGFQQGRFHGTGTLFADAEKGVLFEGEFRRGIPIHKE